MVDCIEWTEKIKKRFVLSPSHLHSTVLAISMILMASITTHIRWTSGFITLPQMHIYNLVSLLEHLKSDLKSSAQNWPFLHPCWPLLPSTTTIIKAIYMLFQSLSWYWVLPESPELHFPLFYCYNLWLSQSSIPCPSPLLVWKMNRVYLKNTYHMLFHPHSLSLLKTASQYLLILQAPQDLPGLVFSASLFCSFLSRLTEHFSLCSTFSLLCLHLPPQQDIWLSSCTKSSEKTSLTFSLVTLFCTMLSWSHDLSFVPFMTLIFTSPLDYMLQGNRAHLLANLFIFNT